MRTGRTLDPEDAKSLERELASQRLRASLPPPPKNHRALTRAGRDALLGVAAEMVKSGDFRRAGPRHMVAVWAWCHERTYGVAPAMTGPEWTRASLAAGTLLKREFDGKVEGMVVFIRWTWAEERRSHQWRIENHRTSTPLGWRLQFSERHIVKWRANGAKP